MRNKNPGYLQSATFIRNSPFFLLTLLIHNSLVLFFVPFSYSPIKPSLSLSRIVHALFLIPHSEFRLPHF